MAERKSYRESLKKVRKKREKVVPKITRHPISHSASDHMIGTEVFSYAFPYKGKAENISIIVDGLDLDKRDPDLEVVLVHYKMRRNLEERHPTKLKAGMNAFGSIEVQPGDRIVVGTNSPAGSIGEIAKAWVTFTYAAQGMPE